MIFDFFAGCLGGLAGVLVGHPLDTIKVNIQVRGKDNPHYQTTFSTLKTLRTKEGFTALYRGVTSPLIGLSGVNAIIFGVFHNVEAILPKYNDYFTIMTAGGLAGFASSFLLCPIELAKTRVQVAGNKAGSNPLDVLMRLHRIEGFKAIFRGLNATMLREVPGNMAYFTVFHVISQPKYESTSVSLLLAGGLAGIASWVVPYPADVVKSKIQADGVFGKRKYTTTYYCFVQTFREEGIRGFYNGVVPTIVRAFPVNALIFFVVTWSRKLYDDISNHKTKVKQIKKK